MGITKKQFINGASWKIVGDFSVKGITFLVSIALMRILTADDYGLIALTNVFTSLSDLLIEGGFSTALIRKEKIEESDYSSVLSISIVLATVLYAIIFLIAPYASNYYNEPLLTPVLRAIGLTLFLQAFTSVRTAIINRNMQFKLLSICNAAGSVASGIIGIAAAYCGLGVWALVIQRLSQMFITNLLIFMKVKLKFRFRIDLGRLKEILGFSIGVVGSSLLNYLGGSIYSVVIGKRYSVSDLGYYDKAGQLPMQLSLYTFGSMSSVLLPTLASYQNDIQRVKEISRKVVRMTSYIIFPMMIGLLCVAKEITVVLFSDTWLPSVPMMKSFCIYYLATPFMLINVQVFFALGHSFLRVKTEILRLVIMGAGLYITGFVLKKSVNEVAMTLALVAVIAALITFAECRKLISYKWKEVAADISKSMAASVIMGAILIGADKLASVYLPGAGYLAMLALKACIGVLLYLLLSKVMRINELSEILELIKGLVHKKNV